VKQLYRIILGTAALLSFAAHATDSLINLGTPGQDYLMDRPPDEDTMNLWERFNANFPSRAQLEFSDTFHPFNMIKRDGEGRVRLFDERYDDTVEMGRDAMNDALSYSLREAALSMDFPIMMWLRDQQDFLASLLWNSLDSVEEKSVAPLELTYQEAERSWWNKVAKSSRLRVGIRPINSSPYAFLSWRFKNEEHVWLLGHVRYRLRGFTDHCFELGLSMPLGNRCSLDFGTLYRIGREEDHKSLVCKLTKHLSENSLLFAGVEAQSHPVLIAGLSSSW